MNTNSRVTLRWPVLAAAGIALLAAGAGATYLVMQRSFDSAQRTQDTAGQATAPPMAAGPQSNARGDSPPDASHLPLVDVVVTLSPEVMKRAGIELAPVTRGAAGSSAVRIPGTVEPNAYKQVIVTPLVAGHVTRVLAELGDRVQQRSDLAADFQPGARGRPNEVPVRKGRTRGARAGTCPIVETPRDWRGQSAGGGTPACGACREAGGRPEPPIAPRAARDAGAVD